MSLEHACEKACVCTTCHVIVRAGFESLRPEGEDEEGQLGKAWGFGHLRASVAWFGSANRTSLSKCRAIHSIFSPKRARSRSLFPRWGEPRHYLRYTMSTHSLSLRSETLSETGQSLQMSCFPLALYDAILMISAE